METVASSVLLCSPRWLCGRVRSLVARLRATAPDAARDLLGSLCAAPGEKISPKSCDELWVTVDGKALRIGDMSPEHLAHSLALIMRNLRGNKYAVISPENKIMFKERKWKVKRSISWEEFHERESQHWY
jgi:hypothetical protein